MQREYNVPSGWTPEQAHGVIVETLWHYRCSFDAVRSDGLRRIVLVIGLCDMFAVADPRLQDALYGRRS